jgi:hypothetical protein
MRFRSVLQEFEAHFHPVTPASKARGKSEWKRYGDGTCRFKLSISNLPLADGSQVDLWRDGSWLMRLSVQNNKLRVDIEDETGSAVPAISAGQILQVRSGEVVLAEGRYEAE